VSGGREPAHVQPNFGDDGLRVVPTNTGNLVEDVDEIQR
jgi:hypothetical protein